ncbi:MAG: SLBB domain-containing protein [Prevotella sp.]|uniref:polysaccharide biosynthesis/export family protein n=1 Tax=Prevotella sp. TaxID=59823 RepID=UPI002588CC49|nr:SLBB domain-containing protein [Prevotella sp.]MDD6854259.1 SLBB domain-containing protein [Prevotella sp.]
MKRYILIVLLSLLTLGTYAQSSMTDNQVLEFVMKEHQKGTSQAQIVTKLMQNGVDISQIRRVRRMAEKLQASTTEGVSRRETTGSRQRRNIGMSSTKGHNSEDITNETRDIYDEQEEKANKYSNMRLHPDDDDEDNTYDEYNPDYVEMQDEMNDWMPADTAAMYRQLVKRLKREKAKKKIYGHDLFSKKSLTFEPNENVAMPRNYRLGPGDAVFIDIYGASQRSIEGTVAPDGMLTIEGFGPINVNGLTVEQANARVRSRLGRRYSSSKIRLSVGSTHSILINVMGEVKKPGTYTLSAFSTAFNALYAAGGPSDLGTLRNIKVYRHNRLVSHIDVYDYLQNGRLSGNIKLADGDVIVVGAYDCLVNISGKVKRPMYYEMTRRESLGTLLRYAAGFSGDAYTKSVRVFRKTGREYSIYNVNEFDFSSFNLHDGDSVSVDSVLPRYENMVEVKGAVYRPGKYQVGGDINSVKTLIEAADGLTESAFTPRAVMHRRKADRTLKVISVDVEGIMSGKVADIPLQNEDVLFIPTKADVMQEQTISIHGEVQYPGTYKYADNETLEDFVLQAGGLKENASTAKVDVSRRTYDPKATTSDSITAHIYSFALKDGFVVDGEQGFVLEPYDEVYVHKSPGTNRQENVEVKGEVLFAGTYALPTISTRLSDIIKAAGGPNNVAYVKGARLERKVNDSERKRMEDALKMARDQQQQSMLEMAARSQNAGAVTQVMQQNQNAALEKFQIPEYYSVGIELDKALAHPGSSADIILREGDRITIPQYNGTVKINGAVMYPNSVGYVEGKSVSYYIDQAGGFASNAKKRNTYILYMNGMVAKVGHNAKVRPGCEIVVPTKANSKLSMAETLSIGSSAASIAAVIATIANLVK